LPTRSAAAARLARVVGIGISDRIFLMPAVYAGWRPGWNAFSTQNPFGKWSIRNPIAFSIGTLSYTEPVSPSPKFCRPSRRKPLQEFAPFRGLSPVPWRPTREILRREEADGGVDALTGPWC